MSVPSGADDDEHEARPDPLTGPEHREVAPTLKATVPPGIPAAEETVAE